MNGVTYVVKVYVLNVCFYLGPKSTITPQLNKAICFSTHKKATKRVFKELGASFMSQNQYEIFTLIKNYEQAGRKIN